MRTSLYLAPIVAITLFACNGGSDDDNGNGNGDGNTIVDVASDNEDFSLLVEAVVRADLAATLSGAGPFTVFAPTNAAFEALLETNPAWNSIDDIDVDVLTDVLLYHVVPANVPSSAIPARADSAADLTLFFDASAPSVNDASITATDIEASNGVIHVIDKVLLPPRIPEAAGFAGLTGLVAAVEHAGAGPVLGANATYTVFAPSNDAFAQLASDLEIEAISDLPSDLVLSVLLYHGIDGGVLSGDVEAGIAESLLNNDWQKGVSLFVGTQGGVSVNGAQVEIADIKTANGIVHVIDKVLLPPTIADAAGLAGLTGLVGAIGASSAEQVLLDVLSGDGALTVFAPTNEAFDDIADVIATLAPETITTVVQTHVIAGDRPVYSDELESGQVETASGASVTIDAGAGTVSWGNTANIAVTDIHTTNGVVHLIDAVLVPPT